MSDLTAAKATKAVRDYLREQGIGDSDYDINSRKNDDGVTTTVILSGWLAEEHRTLITSALSGAKIEGASKPKRQGSEFTIFFG